MSAIGIRHVSYGRPVESTAGARPDHLVLTLTVLGLMASLVMNYTLSTAVAEQMEPGQLFATVIIKPPIYYVAHAIQTLLLVWAGLAALFTTDFRLIQRGYMLRFGLLIAAAIYTAAKGYSTSDWLSTRIVDATGPIGFFMGILVFVGARKGNWPVLSKIIATLAIVFVVKSLFGVYSLSTFGRDEAVARLSSSLNALYWPAAWMVLNRYPSDSFARRVRFVPIVIYAFGSLFTQTRLNFVMLLALLAVFSYLQYKRGEKQAGLWISGLMVAVWVALFVGVFLRDTHLMEKLSFVTDAFYSRMDEDTRTGQLIWFFKSNTPMELLLGKGSFAKWYWFKEMWSGTDVGYLTLLLYGGLPLLVTYFLSHLKPCFALLWNNAPDWQLTAAGIVFLWFVRMFSSSYPGVNIDYYPILFCVGACIAIDPGAQKIRN